MALIISQAEKPGMVIFIILRLALRVIPPGDNYTCSGSAIGVKHVVFLELWLRIGVKHVVFLELWLRITSLELWLRMAAEHKEPLSCGSG